MRAALLLASCLALATAVSGAVYSGFSTQTSADPCTLGPNTWCQSAQEEEICQVQNSTVGVCGYSSGKCPVQTVSDFCANKTRALTFDGGLSGAPPGLFSYYILSAYWPPSNCNPNVNSNNSSNTFCSRYTLAGNEASNHLVAHGLWPDFGSAYNTLPTPPAYTGAYEGWSQFCSGPDVDGYACHVNSAPALCPTANATNANFTQTNYEDCISANNIAQCQIEEEVLTALGPAFQRYAPGYLSLPAKEFISHEYFKHATCVGGYLTANQTAFFEQVVDVTRNVTAPGTPAYTMIHNNRGHSVSRAALEAAFAPTAVPMCQKNCNLDSVSFCVGRDEAGFPTQLQQCTPGTLGSANCGTYNCTSVNIPAYPNQAAAPSGQPAAAPSVVGAPAKGPTANAGAPTQRLSDASPPSSAPISAVAG